MTEHRIVSLDVLRARLRAALGSDSLLAARFDRALAQRDADLVADTMRQLNRYPEPVRRQVHDVILEWLFGPAGSSPLRARLGLDRRHA